MSEEKNKGGRPRFFDDPDKYDTLKKLLKLQCTAGECAGVLGCNISTIERQAAKECPEDGFAGLLKKHGSETLISLRRAMLKKAIEGEEVMPNSKWGKQGGGIKKTDTAMQIFLSKNLLGMRDRQELDIPKASIKLNYKLDNDAE